MRHGRLLGSAALLSITIAAGCSSSPERPVQQLAVAEASVEQARRSDAPRYANAHLIKARDKLEDARDAADRGDSERAEQLAHEAEVDAEYAAAAAQSAKLEEAVAAVRESLNTLRRELRMDTQG